jgi:hypothetical protein
LQYNRELMALYVRAEFLIGQVVGGAGVSLKVIEYYKIAFNMEKIDNG